MQPLHRKSANAALIIVAAIAAAVLVNAIFSQVHLRFDLTAERIFTLSEVSDRTAAKLEEPVQIRAFISPNLPPPHHRLEQRVEELLAEYEAASRGRISYEIISPDDNDEVRELARGYGIEPVTIGQQTDAEQSIREVYKGIAFVKGNRQETIPVLHAPAGEQDDFEYRFTRSLMQLQLQQPRTIGVLTGVGGPADQPGFVDQFAQLFTQTYGELVELTALPVDQLDDTDESFAAIIAINPTESLGEQRLEALDRHLSSGTSLGWFQNGAVIDEERHRALFDEAVQQGHRQPPVIPRVGVDTDLVDYFASLGVQLQPDVVIDRHLAVSHGVVPTSRGPVPVEHPALFPITDIAHELPFAGHFSTLFIPAPAPVNVDAGALSDDVAVYDVLTTPESSVRLNTVPPRLLYDELLTEFDGEQKGAHTIAVAADGPLGLSGTDVEDARLLVVGSGEFIGEIPEVGYGGELAALGIQFFLNSVEWLAQHDDLAHIRGKSMPPLVADVPSSAQRTIQFINIAVVPALFLCIGFWMMIRRRRRKDELSTS